MLAMHTRRMRKSTFILAGTLACALVAALAHPHIFVEARLEVVAGPDGVVVPDLARKLRSDAPAVTLRNPLSEDL